MLGQIEKLAAVWWFDPALSLGLGVVTWLIGGLATWWLFQRGERLRLAEHLRDFADRAMEVSRTLGSDDPRHHIILRHELDRLERRIEEFRRHGVGLDDILACGATFLETAEEAQRRGRNYKTRFGDFIRALKAAIRRLGRGGRYGEMQRALDEMNRRMGQAEARRPLFGLGAPAGPAGAHRPGPVRPAALWRGRGAAGRLRLWVSCPGCSACPLSWSRSRWRRAPLRAGSPINSCLLVDRQGSS